jgi:SAM-dependent methyltransferase
MSDGGWEWHPSLYSSSAAYYVQGRVSYSQELVDALVAELGLDGSGQLLDVGCGPGSLTLLLAPWFGQATGLDADAGMLAEGARQAAAAGISNVDWVNSKAEDLDPDLGPFRAVTLAQSFHWMDQARVARLLHDVVSPDGVLVHVHANTYEGIDGDLPLSHPLPPRREINELVARFLGSRARPGPGGRESEIYQAAGFSGPTRIELPDRVVVRNADDIAAGVFSVSFAAPHLFGDRVDEFETALRALLADASPEGRFSEQMREAMFDIWRP